MLEVLVWSNECMFVSCPTYVVQSWLAAVCDAPTRRPRRSRRISVSFLSNKRTPSDPTQRTYYTRIAQGVVEVRVQQRHWLGVVSTSTECVLDLLLRRRASRWERLSGL